MASVFSPVLPLSFLSGLTGHEFIIPFYHIVSDEQCPHIKNLYRFKNAKEFIHDVDYLARHYQPIGADSLPDVIAGKYKGRKTMLLTFDDGLRQMYEVVAPILFQKGIPAVFFINTDFVDNRALMFRYKASLVLESGGSGSLLKIRDSKAMEGAINEKETAAIDSFLKDYNPYMTTEQIKSLISQGFAIGAHSRSHPYYADLTLEAQLAETFDSLDILQIDFGIKEKLFAFPFTDDGVSKKFFDTIFENNRVDFSFGGAGIKNETHPRQIQRIPMEGWNAGAEQILKSEYLYYMLRAPLFRNTIKRQ
jgi:peptidoglycan/xylan/chitin deacetylase (PgdA/CDA1 family)